MTGRRIALIAGVSLLPIVAGAGWMLSASWLLHHTTGRPFRMMLWVAALRWSHQNWWSIGCIVYSALMPSAFVFLVGYVLICSRWSFGSAAPRPRGFN